MPNVQAYENLSVGCPLYSGNTTFLPEGAETGCCGCPDISNSLGALVPFSANFRWPQLGILRLAKRSTGPTVLSAALPSTPSYLGWVSYSAVADGSSRPTAEAQAQVSRCWLSLPTRIRPFEPYSPARFHVDSVSPARLHGRLQPHPQCAHRLSRRGGCQATGGHGLHELHFEGGFYDRKESFRFHLSIFYGTILNPFYLPEP